MTDEQKIKNETGGVKELTETVKELTAEEFMKTDDIQKEFVNLTKFGFTGGVWLWGMTAKERDAFEETTIVGKGKDIQQNLKNLRARLCARCIRDKNGRRLFKGTPQVEALGEKSAKVLDHLFIKSRKLCGMSNEDVEELTKNLSSDQTGDFS